MEQYGYVNELVDNDELDDRALERVESLARGPSIVQRFTKRAMAADRRDIDTGLEVEAQAFGHLMTTDDLREGIAAFRNDRNPEFTGKERLDSVSRRRESPVDRCRSSRHT